MRAGVVVASLVLLLAGTWAAFEWYRVRGSDLTVRPQEQASAVVVEPRESIVLASLSVPYPVIETALAALEEDLTGTVSGTSRIKCIQNDWPKIEECLDFNYTIDHRPNGPVTVERAGDKLAVTVLIAFHGDGGFGGAIADALDLERKNFSGSFRVTAAASATLDDNFCPKLAPGDVSFAWDDEAEIEIIGRSEFRIFGIGFDVGPWSLDVGRHFNGPIRETLEREFRENAGAIPCEPVRKALAQVWRTYSFPVEIPGRPTLFVNVEPTDLDVAGPAVEDAGLRLAARLAARAVVSDAQGEARALGNLPKNTGATADVGRIDLAVPLALSYDTLREQALAELDGEPITFQTQAGDVVVEVLDLEIFPSGERVAIGVDFSADLPSRLFDAKGVVWLTGAPIIEDDGRVVRVRDVTIAAESDSALWYALTVAFRDGIEAEIEAAASADLTEASAQAIAAIEKAVAENDGAGGVRFRISRPTLRLGRVGAEAERLVVEGIFGADWTAELEEISLRP